MACNSASTEEKLVSNQTHSADYSAKMADSASLNSQSGLIQEKEVEKPENISHPPKSDQEVQKPQIKSYKKLIKTGIIHFKVKNVNETEQFLMGLLAKYNGQLIQNNQSSIQGASEMVKLTRDSSLKVTSLVISDSMEVKIPHDKLADFLIDISKVALLVEDKEFLTDDKTWEFLENQLKAENREKFANRTLNGKIHKDDLTQVLEREDEKVDKIIANRKTDEEVEMAKVNLRFYENPSIFQEKIPFSEILSYKTSFGNRLASGFQSGLDLAEETILFLVKIWFILLIAFMVFLVFKKDTLKKWVQNKRKSDSIPKE